MKKNNFEVIELLIVIAIVAILCAILLPALAKAREKHKSNIGTPTEYNLKKAALQLVEIDSRLEKKYKIYYLDNKITEDEFKKMWNQFLSLNPSYSMDDYPFKGKKKEKENQNQPQNDWLK